MDPLLVECPQCYAKPGQKCKNYQGKGCAPHRNRGKDARKARSRALKRNRRTEEKFPLYATEMRRETDAREYWKYRFEKARAAELTAQIEGFNLLRLLSLKKRPASC
jgi:hypothetical protein